MTTAKIISGRMRSPDTGVGADAAAVAAPGGGGGEIEGRKGGSDPMYTSYTHYWKATLGKVGFM